MSKSMENLIADAVGKLREIADANTIIGKHIEVGNGTTIIPVSRVRVGLGLGGSDFTGKHNTDALGAGAGAGVTVTPMAFLIINNGVVTLKQLGDGDSTANKVVELVPEIFDKVTSMVNNAMENKKNNSNED